MRAKSRRPAREAALRALYESEIRKTDVSTSLASQESFEQLPEELQEYARQVASGAQRESAVIDRIIESKLTEYDLKRVASVDRNLLRIAVFELYYRDDVPPKVTLDEAIELAKKYSTAESGKFVNGVLAAILAESPKKDWTPIEGRAAFEEPAPSEPEPEVVQINEDAPEVLEAAKVGKWKLRTQEREP